MKRLASIGRSASKTRTAFTVAREIKKAARRIESLKAERQEISDKFTSTLDTLTEYLHETTCFLCKAAERNPSWASCGFYNTPAKRRDWQNRAAKLSEQSGYGATVLCEILDTWLSLQPQLTHPKLFDKVPFMEFKRVHEEQREHGHYYAEDMGAGVLGVYFKGKRQRKYRYVATAQRTNGTDPEGKESIKRRIDWHEGHVAKFGLN